MSRIMMECPNGHEPVLDEEKSNDNWVVYLGPCPECSEKLEITYE